MTLLMMSARSGIRQTGRVDHAKPGTHASFEKSEGRIDHGADCGLQTPKLSRKSFRSYSGRPLQSPLIINQLIDGLGLYKIR